MAEEPKELERLVLVRLLRLNARILGTVCGLIGGGGLFLATNFLVLKGGDVVGPHLALLSQFFPGYRVTFPGSLLGFLYAFVTGFAFGYVLARIYNWVADLREVKGRASQDGDQK
jgi:hypothetical protein